MTAVPREYELMGVACVAYPTQGDAVAHIRALVKGGAAGYTVAINAEKIVRAQDDPAFLALIQAALVKVPDGAGAVLALRLLRGVRSAKVDFPRAALQAAAELGNECRLGVVGASEDSLKGAIDVIRRLYPTAQLVVQRSGFVPEETLLEELRIVRPQLCLVAMGTPKQEHFAVRAVAAGIPCVFVGCGGALDILSGHAIRAPQWMVDNYLEWLYRLVQQPSRWRRQSSLPVFARRLFTAWTLRRPT